CAQRRFSPPPPPAPPPGPCAPRPPPAGAAVPPPPPPPPRARAPTPRPPRPTTAGGPPPRVTPPTPRGGPACASPHTRPHDATQARIQALNDGGRPLRDYHLSKSQCWLDVSFHEYSRNYRSAFPQQALDQAVQLIAGMEEGAEPLPTDTPLVNDARHLRDDLWK